MALLDLPLQGLNATKTFADIYPDSATFVAEYTGTSETFANPFPDVFDGDTTKMILLWSLLISRFMNSSIANYDESQFKYRLFSTIWQFAPAWQKKLDIQEKLRNLTDDEIVTGSKTISDHAYNPSTIVEGGPNPDDGIIDTINEQNKVRFVKSKIEGYSILWDMLRADVTNDFLAKFKSLFTVIVEPTTKLLYEGDD